MSISIKSALCELAKSVPGGQETMASMLGMSKVGLQNRLYGVKGQAVSIEDALLMQQFTSRTDFAEAVARESGGVFVRLPDDISCQDEACEEISLQFMHFFAHGGELSREWLDAAADGEVTPDEMAVLQHFYARAVASLAAIIELTERYYARR